jgi:glutathione peroxidase
MIKLLLLFNCLSLYPRDCTVDNIYNYSVATIEGTNISLNNFQGKKILLITLPITRNDNSVSLLHSLDSLYNLHSNSLVIIGTPSFEDGYNIDIKEDLKLWYRSILHQNIIITDGLYTRKSSGSRQDSLFTWLTDKTKNGHFDNDIIGPEQKFFVWHDGELTALMGSQSKIGGRTMNSLLQAE